MDMERSLEASTPSHSFVDIQSLDVASLREWLEDNGIPQEYSEKFEDNFIDGTEFVNLTSGEVKQMVSPLGLAKKIIRMIPKPPNEPPVTPTNSPLPTSQTAYMVPSVCSSEQSPGLTSPVSSECHVSGLSRSSLRIPEHWREETQSHIEQGVLNDTSRSDIVRTLVTLLVAAHGSKPPKTNCEDAARQLILKYPFMRDDFGSGYASWVGKLMECIDNRIKQARKKRIATGDCYAPTPKKKRSTAPKDDLLRRYPIQTEQPATEDMRSIEEHIKAASEEMKKLKPRDHVLLPLMKKTFQGRRMLVQVDAESVQHILDIYAALRRVVVLEQEMSIIVGKKDARAQFEKLWINSFVPGLLLYAERSNNKVLRKIFCESVSADETSKQTAAFKILVVSMKCSMKKDADKADVQPLDYVYKEYDVSKTPEMVSRDKSFVTPRIAAFVGEENVQYFVIIEGQILCEVPSFQFALFVCFSCFYIFHLDYPKIVKNVFFFLQDYVLAFPDSQRRPPVYLATASDIKKLSIAK